MDIGGTNITSTASELNILDGVTSTTAELNILDGVTANATELNILDGVTSTTAELNILDGVTADATELNILDGVTSTTAELNILDGVTATTTELNYVDGVTSAIQTQIDGKQATVTAGDGLEFTGSTLAVDLAASIIANESFTLSGMTDSTHNDTYHLVYRSGVKFKATFDQSGSDIKISTDREGEYFLTVSGTGVTAIDDGGALSVHKHTGYVTRSTDTFTWSTGSSGGDFHWYYFDDTDDIFVCWNSTDATWMAFDLESATGNVASFISDLQSTGSTAGYVSGGENFICTSGNRASLTANKDTYPGTTIIDIPDAADSNITYGTADSHPYYVFQNSAANKWVAFSLDSSYYWTAWHRSAAFDLRTESLTDDATAFTLDDSSDFEFITTNSDDYGDGTSIPDADASEVTYLAAAAGAYLEFDSGELKAQVKDEDNMISDSADHLATQQSIKAYVDGAVVTTLSGDSGTASPSSQTFTIAGGTGLTSSATSATVTVTLDDTAVTAAEYGSASETVTFTVDAQGRLTAASEQTISITHDEVSDFDTAVQTSRLDQMATPTADVALGSNKITGLADPTNDQDAATKLYVDEVAQGISAKDSVRLATAAALPAVTYANGTSGVGATLTADAVGALTVDGTAVALNDRVLVKDQTLQEHNGIYYVSTLGDGSTAFVLTRVTDNDESDEMASSFVFVEEGTANDNSGFVCTTDLPVTMGTTDIVWTQFSGAGQVTAGTGLTKSGNTINAIGTTDRISVSADAIDIASTYVGQTSITTLGTIATGTWNGTALTGTYIGNDEIDSQHYAAGSIDNEHLAANSVDSDQYVDGSIDSAHLSLDVINSGTLIADNVIDSEHYVDGSIDTEHIADDQVTSDKMSHTGVSAATYGSATQVASVTVDVAGRVTAASNITIAPTTVATIQGTTDATHYLTFVDSDNVSAAQETVYTDAGVTYNPNDNLLTVGEVSVTTLDIGGTDVTSTAAELNILDGVTADATEINILDGVTATTAELNYLDITTLGTSEDSKVLTQASGVVTIGATSGNQILNIASHDLVDGGLQLAGTLVTASAAELNTLDGITSTTAELNILDGVTATASELNVLDGVTAFVDEDNMASDSATSIPSQQSVKAYVDANETHIDNIMTLLGETKDDTDLGTFTGDIISDNTTVRAALQELETEVEGDVPVRVDVRQRNWWLPLPRVRSCLRFSGTHASGKPTGCTLADC